MKQILKKFNTLFNALSRQKFLFALFLCAAFSFIYLAANGFMITSQNDDYCVFKAIYGGNTAVPCLGYFYTALCVLIQPLFGALNIYMTLQEIICFFSLTAINYFFLSKLGTKRGLFYAAVFDALFFSCLIIEIMYTFTAVVAATAGLLCLFYGTLYEKRRAVKIFQIICGFVLLFTSTQLRLSPFLACCGIGAVFAAGVFFSRIAKKRKDEGMKRAFSLTLKRYAVTGALLIAAIISAIGLNVVSDTIKNSSADYQELSTYYQSLSAVTDAKANPYIKNSDRLKEAGLKSSEDFSTLQKWFVDDDFFTVERLNVLSEIINEDSYDGLMNKSVFEQTLYPFKISFTKLIENKSIILYLLVLIVAVFAVVFLSILFPKAKWLLIKLLLLAFTCSFYFIISDVFSIKSILLVPLMAVSLLIILRYDRFQAVITLFIMAGLLIPYAYLVSIRLYFYVSFAPIFPAFVLMIFGLDKENLLKFKNKPKRATIALSSLAVITAAVFVLTGVYVFTDYEWIDDRESNPIMEKYIAAHPETVFLINQTTLTRAYYNPFILPSKKNNVVNYGLWLTKAKCFKDSQKTNGIDHLFKDSINSNMRIINWEENISYENGSVSLPIHNLTVYYNNHYAEHGEKIELVQTDRIGNYSLYAVVSEPVSDER